MAKRLIGNYHTEQSEAKALGNVETVKASSVGASNGANASSLSSDLQSRLSFSTSSSTSTPSSQPVVKFNEDSLRSKVVVSSTTADNDDGATSKLKRKISDYNDDNDDSKLEYVFPFLGN